MRIDIWWALIIIMWLIQFDPQFEDEELTSTFQKEFEKFKIIVRATFAVGILMFFFTTLFHAYLCNVLGLTHR